MVGICLAFASAARAAESVENLIARLEDQDFRVRTQAALALGAANTKRAVEPLCGALDDPNTTVRAAAAAALGRLQLGGRECLEQHADDETSAAVRSVIQKALARLGGGGASLEIRADTRYYLSIGPTTNKTSRPKGELDSIVRRELLRAFSVIGGFAAAPKQQTVAEAKALLAKHKNIKALFLWPKVDVTQAGANLVLRMELSLFSYPDKAFKGSASRKLTMPDTDAGDTSAQDELIRMASERLARKVADTAERL